MDKIKPAVLRQIFVLILILLLGGLIFWELSTYLSGILGAITIYLIMRNWMIFLVKKGWSHSLAAITLMIASFLCFLLPIAAIVLLLTSKVSKAIKNSSEILAFIKDRVNILESTLGFDLSKNIDLSKVTVWLSSNLEQLAGGTFNAFIAIGIMYFLLYYMFTNVGKLKDAAIEYIPLSRKNIIEIGIDSNGLVKSNAIGIPLVALLQGIVALIAFLILGVPDPFFWFVITAIGSMIPFIGSSLGIIPVCILLYSTGQTWQSIVLLIYGIAIVGSTDNFFRLVIQRKLADVHPLITLFGVIVGVPLFGFIGLIFGPLLVSLFILIVKIYKNEYGKNEDRL
ncbi:MAG: AI-2E family transporter [Bacteroidota bacterium]|nr:AI-2E family transporter [Bacteroidota bacterium]